MDSESVSLGAIDVCPMEWYNQPRPTERGLPMTLVVGASGKLGRAVVRRLVREGKPVRAMSRRPDERLRDLKQDGVEITAGDLRDQDSLARACSGVSRVIASAHSIIGRGAERSALVDDEGHRSLIDAAKAAGVGHFIYVSALGASAEHPAAFFRYKFAVEEYLRSSGVPYSIIRPTAFAETHAYELLGKSILEKGKASILGSGTGRRNFVVVGDVADLILLVCDDPSAVGQTIEIGGPPENNLTNNEVVTMFESAAGRTAKVVHAPRGMLRVMSAVLRPLHPGLSQVMASSLHDDLNDAAFDASKLLERYALELTTLEEWIGRTVTGGASPTNRTDPAPD